MDNYALLLQASASDVVHHDGESNGHWAGHRGPVTVKPSELVSLFSSRVAELLAEHEEGEEYEATHWTRRLAAFDSRDDLTPQRGDVNELLMKHEKARKQSFAVLEKAVDDAEMTKTTPSQLHEELAGFEVASSGREVEAEESVRHFEANIRDLQAAAPRVAQRQFSKVNAEIGAELVRRNTLMEEGPIEEEVPGSPGQSSRSRRASRENSGVLSSEGLLLSAVSPSGGSVLAPSAFRLPAAGSGMSSRDEEPDWKELGLVGGSKLAMVARRVVSQVIASRNQAKRQQEESEQREHSARERLEKQKECRLRQYQHLSEEAQPREATQQTEPMHEIVISGELHAKLTEAEIEILIIALTLALILTTDPDSDPDPDPKPNPDPNPNPNLTTQAEIEIGMLGKQLEQAQETIKLMEPPEKDRVSLNAARRSLERTEMASGNDNWSGQGSYLNPDSLRHKGTSTLELEESGTKELERQLLYAKGDARQARARTCMLARARAPPHSVDT